MPHRFATISTLLVLATLVVLGAVQIAGIADNLQFTIFWAVGTAVMASAVTYSVYRRDFGGAVAWGYIALALDAGLVLLSLQVARMQVTPVCSAIYSSCPVGSPVLWVPLGLSAGALWSFFLVLRESKALQPDDER